jgi:dihydrofolate reductase
MAELVVFTSVTIDGVMQAPGRPDEDRRGGFQHGGWAMPYASEEQGKVASEAMGTTAGIVLGRRTYEDFASFWPKQPEPNPFTDVLTNTQKYVASRTLREPLPWENSTLLQGDAGDAVGGLKEQHDNDLVVLGSGELVRELMRRRLVDRFVLLVHPLVLGSGRRLFEDGGPDVTMRLLDSRTTSTGVIIATYEPDV